MKQPIVLKVFKADVLEAVRQFEHSQIVVGRGDDAQLQLADEGVALLHAMIEDRDGEYFLSDLGSQTGTFKNGARVLEDRLASGDSVNVGPYKIQFFIGVPKPAAPPKLQNAAPTEAPAANAVRFNDAAKQPDAAPPAEVPAAAGILAALDPSTPLDTPSAPGKRRSSGDCPATAVAKKDDGRAADHSASFGEFSSGDGC